MDPGARDGGNSLIRANPTNHGVVGIGDIHIPGAVHASRGQLEFFADPGSDSAKPEITANHDARIIVQCEAGARSLLAAQTLKKMGYTNVTSMAGGFRDWSALGYPVE